MAERTETWADGLGLWRASVPISNEAAERKAARAAIRAELILRSAMSRGFRLRLRREHVTNHGTVHYVEDR